jgi:hypothetical protein
MKRLIFIGILTVFIVNMGFCQYSADDYPEPGSSYSMINYVSNTGDVPVFLSRFGDVEGSWKFDSIQMFSEYVIDTLYYSNPSEYDMDGNFPEATHVLLEGNTETFIVKDAQKAEAIGFSGDMFDIGMDFPIVAESPLKLMEFPTTTNTSFSGSAYGEHVMPVEALESIIPADSYATFAGLFDSVKVIMTIENVSEIISTSNIIIDLGSVDSGNFDCLLERNDKIMNVDIYVRSAWTGAWSPLSSVPSVSDMLPMDLPMIDTTHTLNWWKSGYSLPLAQAETSQLEDTVFGLTFNYNGLSSIQNNELAGFSIFPNPATSYVSVNLTDLNSEISSLEIVNSLGTIQKQFTTNGEIFNFDVEDLPSGYYFVRLLDNNNKLKACQRLIIQN